MRTSWALSCLLLFACSAPKPPALPPGAPDGVADHSVPVFDALGQFVCSGVVVSAHTVLTAAHCLADSRSVTWRHLPVVAAQALLEGVDIAALTVVDRLPVPAAAVGGPRGHYQWVAGYGCDRFHSRLGIRQLVALDGQYTLGHVCPGDSGGPVYSERGYLVGLVSAYYVTNLGNAGTVVAWLVR